MNELHGAGVALVTPFNADGTVDFDSLAQLIDYQIDSGMNYLVSLGTTGEVATLTKDERKRIWDFTVKQVNARVPLVAGIGGNNTAEIVEQIKNFDPTGFCAILSVSPYYNKPVQEGIYQHYKAIAEASPLPIILYNVPGRTGSNMTPATTIRLAKDFKNIVATKEASGNFAQFNEILRDKPADFLLISGDDPATLPMMALGAVGIISVVGNAYPAQVSKLAALCTAGSFTEARTIHNALLEITDLCFVEGNPCGVKYILQEKGIGQDYVRLPLIPVSANIQTAIKAEMQKLK
ncbi:MULTISPECIES: 4-hydroxy-tetrahydrodipicolinate synthase [Sphingobacterium]|uniref:4-hydroxy-tetrahydrodipicolinate synthase n=1 Tax=Sphingobacterium kitahiroshimense TaxID=470446 RepID=A0ABV0BPQ1_9SPHI|nr:MULTISPECIES: 4-hydroxy-tetrahydrodipicolinate synthase [unclassified Sphingobacterium]MBB2952057.1 4-hydroxy-tetrahydrodipicolinate synthase [Sphingobacterium sp. JUb56]MCS3553938.1 4-hydroxy-tetrahydrodipicolinate synthase [Sphingobacterium sp. JUb21]QQD13779.1 4-hydroxy-tetrahydrodipicolinate synthase [Sphingobacterium sp. UDSM-2020]TCR05257.1 dihydrodipicolinate synthase [Sphingobacterium sp. JUb20]